MKKTRDQLIEEALLKQTEILDRLTAEKATPAMGTTATPLHGLGAIIIPGTERDVLTSHIQPRGILSTLTARPSLTEDPTYATITGFTDVTGTELTLGNVCDDAPAGYMKACNLTARFGLIRRDTKTIDALEVIRRANRGDFTDLIMHGQLLGLQGFNPSGLTQAQILNIYTLAEMIGVGVQVDRELNTGIWQGTIAAFPYFPGLDSQIATGQVDADTNTACTSLDSDVKDFNYNDVCGTTLDIVEYMSMMAYYLEWNAQSAGLDPVDWVICMRPQLFFELTACWPCKYLTNRCKTANVGYNAMVINDQTNMDMTTAMRNGSFLWINGKQWPVIVDTGIYEHNQINQTGAYLLAGEYASSIYFVPLRVKANGMGAGLEVTQLQYLDYRAAQVEMDILPRGQDIFWWTDNGQYSWALDQAKWCYKLCFRMEPRILLLAPQLAGKIQHIRYSPLQHLRDVDPDSPYHVDGGVSLRSTGTRYAVWGTDGYARQ